MPVDSIKIFAFFECLELISFKIDINLLKPIKSFVIENVFPYASPSGLSIVITEDVDETSTPTT